MKSDLKMIMSYLHYSLLNFHTYDMLAELIENFYNKETEMSIEKSEKGNLELYIKDFI